MPDGRRRSREGWADAMEDGPPVAPAHTHRLPPAFRVAFIGMVAAVFLLLVAVGLMAVSVYQANQYVQGRGEYRDREQQRLEEQIRRSTCDLLDQLPAGGLLDRPRGKYGCGPGIPIDQLSPDEQAQLNGARTPPALPAMPDGVELLPDDFSAGASPNVQRPQPYYPTPGMAEPPATVPYPEGFPPPDPVQPSDPPLVDPQLVPNTLCNVLPLCD